jgi:hypothetical protein
MVTVACRKEAIQAEGMSRNNRDDVQLWFARGGRVKVWAMGEAPNCR